MLQHSNFFPNRDCKILRSFSVLLLSKLFSKSVICLWKTIIHWNAKGKQKDQQHTWAMFRHCLRFSTSRKAKHREVTVCPKAQKPSATELGIETNHCSPSNKVILDRMQPAPAGLGAHRRNRQTSVNTQQSLICTPPLHLSNHVVALQRFFLRVEWLSKNFSSHPTNYKIQPQSQCNALLPTASVLWSPLEKLVSSFKQLSPLQIVFFQAFYMDRKSLQRDKFWMSKSLLI